MIPPRQRLRRLLTVLGVLLADARAHRLQTLTTCLGVAVGVAVVVAVRISSDSALSHFRETVQTFTGAATHELRGNSPLPAARLGDLLRHPQVKAAQPIVESNLLLELPGGGARPLRLVGIDPFLSAPFLQLDEQTLADASERGLFERLLTEPSLVLMSESSLAEMGLWEPGSGAGSVLPARGPEGPLRLVVEAIPSASLAAGEPPIALADLATAQELLGLGSRVTRFDLILDGEESQLSLLAGERLSKPAARGERAASMTDAFRTNLLCLGFLAVLVGGFLAYNMAQFAVVRRRPLLGRLRCLGADARTLMAALLLEATCLGLLGSAVGIGLGWLMAHTMVADVARTVSTLYGYIETPVPQLDALTLALAAAVGTLAAVAATWAPARSAARTSPAVIAGRRHTPNTLAPLWVPAALFLGGALLLLPSGSAVLLPAVTVLAWLLASANGLPHLLGRVVRWRVHRPVLALAFGRIQRSLGRTGSAAGALAMPLAMTIAILVMVGSFRAEVTAWSSSILSADVYVKPLYQELYADTARLSPDLLQAFADSPEVEAVDRLRLTEQTRGDISFLVAGSPMEATRARRSMRVISGGAVPELMQLLDAGEALISEPLANRLDLSVGDTLQLDDRDGGLSMPIAGVFQDFSWDRGYALLSEQRYLSIYGDTGVRNAALLLSPGTDADAYARSLSSRFEEAEFRTVEVLRQDILRAFNDTFAITYVLQTISTALALVGILTAVLCLHLERRSELGVLRALGARQRTVGRLLMVEALVLLGVAAAAAIPVGLGLAWVLVSVVNTRSFGWSFPMLVEVGPIAGLMGMALLAGLLAGCVPWWLVRKAAVADLLESRR